MKKRKPILSVKRTREKMARSGVLAPIHIPVGLEKARAIYNAHHKLSLTTWQFRRLCYDYAPRMGMAKRLGKPSPKTGVIRGTNWECVDQRRLLAFQIP